MDTETKNAATLQKIQNIVNQLNTLLLDKKIHNKIVSAFDEVLREFKFMTASLDIKTRRLETSQLGLAPKTYFGFLFSKNKKMQKLFLLAEVYKESSEPLLILGEKGCGKEALARIIHMRSARRGSFVVYNPSQSVKDLLSQEDATHYFSDVSLTTPAIQKMILEYWPLASSRNNRIIISASMLSELEPELSLRLKTSLLKMIPLRERKEDLLSLIDFFIREFSKNEKNISHFSTSALIKLTDYPWPGNTSELKLEIKRILLENPQRKYFSLDVLSEKIVGSTLKEFFGIVQTHPGLPQALEMLEHKMVAEALVKFQGNKSKVSRELGISRSGLIQKIQKFNLLYFSKFSETNRRITSRNSDLISMN